MNTTEKTTRYTYDDQRAGGRTLVSGGVETDFRYYVFGNYIDEVLVMGYRLGSSWLNFYYGHDHLYSPAIMFAPNGTPAERYEYDVYGAVQILTANYEPRTTSSLANPYTFTGRERDTLDAGRRTLMYYRARTTDPETGRFVQRDPLGINPAGGIINPFYTHNQYKDGMNMYTYVKGNPVGNLDSMGLFLYNPITPVFPPEGARSICDWFRKKDCTPWENSGPRRETHSSQLGCKNMNLIDAVSPIFEVIGGCASVILGIAGEVLEINVPVCNQPMLEGYVYPGQPCECAAFYTRKCKRTCCQFGRRRNDSTTLKVAYRLYGVVVHTGWRNQMRCSCYYPSGVTPDMLRNAIDNALDCNRLNN